MGDIRTALTNLVTLQESLSITAPISSSILRAYKFTPPQSSSLPDTPCFLNTWTLTNWTSRCGSCFTPSVCS